MFLVPQLRDFAKAEVAPGPRAPRPVSVYNLDTGHSMSLVLQPPPSRSVRASMHVRFHVGLRQQTSKRSHTFLMLDVPVWASKTLCVHRGTGLRPRNFRNVIANLIKNGIIGLSDV